MLNVGTYPLGTSSPSTAMSKSSDPGVIPTRRIHKLRKSYTSIGTCQGGTYELPRLCTWNVPGFLSSAASHVLPWMNTWWRGIETSLSLVRVGKLGMTVRCVLVEPTITHSFEFLGGMWKTGTSCERLSKTLTQMWRGLKEKPHEGD